MRFLWYGTICVSYCAKEALQLWFHCCYLVVRQSFLRMWLEVCITFTRGVRLSVSTRSVFPSISAVLGVARLFSPSNARQQKKPKAFPLKKGVVWYERYCGVVGVHMWVNGVGVLSCTYVSYHHIKNQRHVMAYHLSRSGTIYRTLLLRSSHNRHHPSPQQPQ
jgi:hypothetical protein